MYTVIAILIFLDCLLLIGIVLIQESKGGGLASSFSASNQVMGVKKTGDFLEKATWTLAVALLVLSLVSAAVQNPGTMAEDAQQSEIKEYIQGTQPVMDPQGFQNNPTPVPSQQTQQQQQQPIQKGTQQPQAVPTQPQEEE